MGQITMRIMYGIIVWEPLYRSGTLSVCCPGLYDMSCVVFLLLYDYGVGCFIS